MRDEQELRVAWILWETLTDMAQSLWDRYEDGFVEIIIEEQELKKSQQAMEGNPWMGEPTLDPQR